LRTRIRKGRAAVSQDHALHAAGGPRRPKSGWEEAKGSCKAAVEGIRFEGPAIGLGTGEAGTNGNSTTRLSVSQWKPASFSWSPWTMSPGCVSLWFATRAWSTILGIMASAKSTRCKPATKDRIVRWFLKTVC